MLTVYKKTIAYPRFLNCCRNKVSIAKRSKQGPLQTASTERAYYSPVHDGIHKPWAGPSANQRPIYDRCRWYSKIPVALCKNRTSAWGISGSLGRLGGRRGIIDIDDVALMHLPPHICCDVQNNLISQTLRHSLTNNAVCNAVGKCPGFAAASEKTAIEIWKTWFSWSRCTSNSTCTGTEYYQHYIGPTWMKYNKIIKGIYRILKAFP